MWCLLEKLIMCLISVSGFLEVTHTHTHWLVEFLPLHFDSKSESHSQSQSHSLFLHKLDLLY